MIIFCMRHAMCLNLNRYVVARSYSIRFLCKVVINVSIMFYSHSRNICFSSSRFKTSHDLLYIRMLILQLNTLKCTHWLNKHFELVLDQNLDRNLFTIYSLFLVWNVWNDIFCTMMNWRHIWCPSMLLLCRCVMVVCGMYSVSGRQTVMTSHQIMSSR